MEPLSLPLRVFVMSAEPFCEDDFVAAWVQKQRVCDYSHFDVLHFFGTSSPSAGDS